MLKTTLIDAKQTKIIAHRGLSGIECENTLAAFIAAGNRNYFGIETDVHKTNDGNFIIIHDGNTGRVSNVNLSVEESDFDDLRKVILNDKDSNARVDLHLPTLEEYLKVCNRYDKIAVLEIKNKMNEAQIKGVIDIVKSKNYIDNTIFISFDFDNLVEVRKALPNAKIQFLCDKADDEIIKNLKKYNFDIDVWHGVLTKELIEKLHADNILVNCWTCDDKQRAEELIEWNVDFITTNILQDKN